MKDLVSFRSRRFPIPQVEEDSAPGYELASALLEGLAETGVAIESPKPIQGEGGWSLWISRGSIRWRLFLNTVGVGAPPLDFWLLGISLAQRGFLRLLRRQQPQVEALDSLRPPLEKVLADLGAEELRWWAERELLAEVAPRSPQ
jgi:hypothetical protein